MNCGDKLFVMFQKPGVYINVSYPASQRYLSVEYNLYEFGLTFVFIVNI